MNPAIVIGWEITPEEVSTLPSNYKRIFLFPYKEESYLFGALLIYGKDDFYPKKLMEQEISQLQEKVPSIRNREPQFYLTQY